MSTPDEQPKRSIPPLRKKGRSLADIDPTSLVAALHHRELAAASAEPTEPPAQPPTQPSETKTEREEQ